MKIRPETSPRARIDPAAMEKVTKRAIRILASSERMKINLIMAFAFMLFWTAVRNALQSTVVTDG
jgi:hypothetical protein